jgi:hypothetical protein
MRKKYICPECNVNWKKTGLGYKETGVIETYKVFYRRGDLCWELIQADNCDCSNDWFFCPECGYSFKNDVDGIEKILKSR